VANSRFSLLTEVAVGAMMLLGGIALFFLAMQVSNLGGFKRVSGYQVEARFDNIGGLKVRSPVTMAGVRIGEVSSINFDSTTYEAVVTLDLQPEFNRVPTDTFAKILTQGILGEQYIGLDPGGSEQFLTQDSEITMTQSAFVLEEIVGQFLFSKAEESATGGGF
jgi:phospholipid/cholesterol/gamma-HCH transport system substrate-binding protein